MRRIVTPVTIANALDLSKEIRCDVLVDTGASGLILPAAWRDRLGSLPAVRTVDMETADRRVVTGEVCGPARIQIEGFDTIFNEVVFIGGMEIANALRLMSRQIIEDDVDPAPLGLERKGVRRVAGG